MHRRAGGVENNHNGGAFSILVYRKAGSSWTCRTGAWTNARGQGGYVPSELTRDLNDWLERTGDTFGTTDDYMSLIDLETGLVRDREKLKQRNV